MALSEKIRTFASKNKTRWSRLRTYTAKLSYIHGEVILTLPEGEELYRAILYGEDLHEADFRGADLSMADLSMADLSDADLTNADLSSASTMGTNFDGAILEGATLPMERRSPCYY